MNLLSIENLSKSYSEKILFNNISLGINDGDKIGIIGINGTGKSTLLKITAGLENADNGQFIIGNKVTVEYLPQEPYFDDEAQVLEQIFKGNSPAMRLLREYENVIDSLNRAPEDKLLQKRLMELNAQMDAYNTWEIESEAKSVLTKLGIYDFSAKLKTLSGGQKKRIALAGALISPADLLILDEPTNHIDNETVVWLEQYLNKRKGALLMVTHDRYFLDRVVNKIIELDNGDLYTYLGNYSDFVEKKLEREEHEISEERKRQNLYRKELAWIKRGAKARSTKQKARIDRFEKLKEEKTDINTEKIDISVPASRLGKKVVELKQIKKSFSDKEVINDFSYIVLRNDRVGIIGPNGIGKSTLINMITGKVKPESGSVDTGETVKIGCFNQQNEKIDEDLRVIDYIREVAEYLPIADGTKITASQMLERFLFSRNAQWTPISKLSGGEKRRLYLLRVLMGAPNVLILDEPTNDLDIQTLTILEDYLDEFSGAVITVSHDRYFLDRVVDKVFAFEGKGKITQYVGGYSDYLEALLKKPAAKEDETIIKKGKKNNKDIKENNKSERPLKFTFKEQKEYDEIDEIIENAEKKLEEINDNISNAGSDYVLLQELLDKQRELEKQLEELLDRWTYLNELAVEIEKNKKLIKGEI